MVRKYSECTETCWEKEKEKKEKAMRQLLMYYWQQTPLYMRVTGSSNASVSRDYQAVVRVLATKLS